MVPGASPVATGMSREYDYADQEPGYKTRSTPASPKANTVFAAVTPVPQLAVTLEVWVAPRSAKYSRSSAAERNLPWASVTSLLGAEIADGIWPATGSIGSDAPV